MTESVPLFRLIKVNQGDTFVTASLWESHGDEWHYNGNLTMTPEGFTLLQALMELGGRRSGITIQHVDAGWIATETGYTRKEWML